MRRRHLLALVILALVVATVLAMGPVRVWDALTLRKVEEYYDNGSLSGRYYVRWWEPEPADYEAWEFFDERGRLVSQMRLDGFLRHWADDGRLRTAALMRNGDPVQGVYTTETVWVSAAMFDKGARPGDGVTMGSRREMMQVRYVDGTEVETRTSPPWFTEEEILQSVEGVEE